MTAIEAVALIVTALVVPYVVQLIKTEAITGNGARWLAIGVSLIAGGACAIVGGIPDTPLEWVTCIGTAIGAVQFAYAAFKSVGVTSKWLDALQALKLPKDSDDPVAVANNIALEAKSENVLARAKHAMKNHATDD